MGLWWVNAIAGIVCLALGINFIAQAYGLKLGGKPWDISHLKVTDPRQVIDVVPLTQKNSIQDELKGLRGTIRLEPNN